MKTFSKNRDGFVSDDIKYMKLAVKLAEKGRGKTSPNPMVGAVIVKDGKIISKGYHKKAGCAHAEIEAIKNCKELLEGSTMYVTLEPCTIYGKTPPCADEIIKHKFKEVVIGCIDPNPLVNGRGVDLIKKSGISVRKGLLKNEISAQNEIFFKNIKTNMPFVCCKIASSIDGKLATKTSDSKWITSEKSRKIVQHLRKEYGCVLTGINTVLADNPFLLPRKKLGAVYSNADFDISENQKFYRVILDRRLRIKLDSNIVKTSNLAKTIIFTDTKNNLKNKSKANKIKEEGIDIMLVDTIGKSGKDSRKLDIKEILDILYKQYGITSILLEAGPTVITSFLKSNLIDKFIIFLAPKIIGGDSKYSMFSKLDIDKVKNSLKVKFAGTKKIGEDVVIFAYPAKQQPSL
jgi:diaminohydroxyphosphoribosylaminopyrimidine deaminase/5-amino-6-(5-phosphoribosylamino)uracil reductase